MIVETTDPLGTEYACVRPGGSRFVYESEDSFSNGWAIALWFSYKSWSTLVDRVITLEDLDDSANDLRVELLDDAGTRRLRIGGIDTIWEVPDDEWVQLFITSIPGSSDVYHSMNSIEAVRISPTQIPLNSRINIGGAPDREFRGDMFDIRIYDKPLSSKSGNVLYDDAINNQGKRTVPL